MKFLVHCILSVISLHLVHGVFYINPFLPVQYYITTNIRRPGQPTVTHVSTSNQPWHPNHFKRQRQQPSPVFYNSPSNNGYYSSNGYNYGQQPYDYAYASTRPQFVMPQQLQVQQYPGNWYPGYQYNYPAVYRQTPTYWYGRPYQQQQPNNYEPQPQAPTAAAVVIDISEPEPRPNYLASSNSHVDITQNARSQTPSSLPAMKVTLQPYIYSTPLPEATVATQRPTTEPTTQYTTTTTTTTSVYAQFETEAEIASSSIKTTTQVPHVSNEESEGGWGWSWGGSSDKEDEKDEENGNLNPDDQDENYDDEDDDDFDDDW